MKAISFGKRQGFADKTCQVLPQGVEPALNMVGFATIFAYRLMTACRKNLLVSMPIIAKRETPFVGQRDAPPELQATDFTTVPDEIGNNLSGTTAQDHPDPPFVRFLEDKGSQLIQFQHIIQLDLGQSTFERRQMFGPVLNPIAHRAPRNPKQALNAPQANAFEYGPLHLITRLLMIAPSGIQSPVAIAGMAMIFLCAFVVMAVFYHIFAAAFSPDSQMIVAGGSQRRIRAWDAATGEDSATLNGHRSTVGFLAFSPDGRLLVSAGDDSTMRLWDMDRHELVQTLEHGDWMNSAVFSPDGSLLATGGREQNVIVWDVESGTLLQQFPGHRDYILRMAFSPDGRQLASASWDSTIRVWSIDGADD